MGIVYIITTFILLVTFLLVKKSDQKLNSISWIILSIIMYLGYNIGVCFVLGNIGIQTNLICLSIVNICVSVIFAILIWKTKTKQTYYIRKKDIVAVILVIAITTFIGVKQYRPYDGTIATASVDGCMHFSAATNFADHMQILSKIDNKTGYNFLTMQPGAYINTGIMMRVMRTIFTDAKDFITFKYFEMGIFALNVLAFYMLIADKLKTKYKTIIGFVFLSLYAFAYPYTSLLYGFSYLSVAIAFCTSMFYLAKVYAEKEIRFPYVLGLIVVSGIGIIFSYCLFVPAMFTYICIHTLLFSEDKKHTFLKKECVWCTGILLLVTMIGILYLVIPTFTVSTQNKLTDAISFEGGIYKGLFVDFVFYIPFIIVAIYEAIQKRKITPTLLALLFVGGQACLSLLGLVVGIVSSYYYYKIYYIFYILVVSIAVEVMCDYTENKEISCFMLSGLVVFVAIILSATMEIEVRIQMKYPGLMDEVKSNQLAGIYFDTNVQAVRNINASCIVDANRVKLAEAMGKVEDMTLKNMLVGGMNTNCKAWIYVIAGLESGGESINDLQTAVVETSVEDWLEKEGKEYFVLFTGDSYQTTEEYELVFQNEAGVILKKK